MRKALIGHATMFEFDMTIDDEIVNIYLQQEESKKWTVSKQGKEMWHKEKGWEKEYPYSHRRIQRTKEVEMTLEEAYSIVISLAI